jgi:predicted ribosome quality control (RQC) complex YloA/Tae2 family protein
MPFDALTLHAVTDELRATVLGGRVQKALLPTERTLAVEIFAASRRRWLLCSAEPDSARAHLIENAPTRAMERVTPFLLLVRKHIRGARLIAISQPPLERILELRFGHGTADAKQVVLILELMGRRSNCVLVDEDSTIMDCLARVSARVNPSRPLLPHLRYSSPPAQDRLDPRLASSFAELEHRLAADRRSTTLASFLQAHLAGLSPRLSAELSFRAAGTDRAVAAEPLPVAALQSAARELFAPLESRAWEPHLILRDGEPVDVTPYRPHQVPAEDRQAIPTISEGLERLYEAGPRVRPMPLQRAPMQAALAARRQQLERKLAALQRSLEGAADAEALRAAGETILANLAAIGPDDDTVSLAERRVAIDPRRTPLENAQAYFRDYARARDAGRVVPGLLQQTRHELTYLDEMTAQVDLAEDQAGLEQLRRELVAAGLAPPSRADAKRKRSAPARGGFRQLRIGDFEVLLGTSALGNEQVTFHLSAPDDIWVHARGVPGSHVVLRSAGRLPPPGILEQVAALAARHSAARSDASVLVDWVPRKHVRKIRGAGPGLVTYVHETTVQVRPSLPTGAAPSRQDQ